MHLVRLEFLWHNTHPCCICVEHPVSEGSGRCAHTRFLELPQVRRDKRAMSRNMMSV